MLLKNPEVRIETVATCNTSCSVCPRSKLTREIFEIMPMGHFRNLVDQARNMGAKTISLFGFGEPLMDPMLPQRISYCHNNGLNTFVTTNGSLLTPVKSQELIAAGLTRLRVSAHGVGREYEKIHKLHYKTLHNNVKHFYGLSRECTIDVIALVFDRKNIERIKFTWKDITDGLEIWEPHNWVDGKRFREKRCEKKTCGRPFNGPVQIINTGEIIVCCFDFNAEMIMGDTYEKSIEMILKGPEFNKIRNAHKTGRLKNLLCARCDQLNPVNKALIYSTIDPDLKTGVTSSCKINVEEV